jgi:small-conductance mechanosensitive channel
VSGSDVPAGDWLVAITVAALVTLALYAARAVLGGRLRRWARATATPVDDFLADAIARTRWFFLLGLGLYAGSHFLDLPPRPAQIINAAAAVAVLLQAGLWGHGGIVAWLERAAQRQPADTTSVYTLKISGFVARVVLWSVLVLMILDNLGFNITALVASLGIGGVAVALAVQNILGDIFASLSIALDRPFEIGDFIVVGDCLGTVEKVGIKTTRLRSLSGEQIVMSNSDLLNSRIRNYKRMDDRRALFQFGIVYQTPYEKLQAVPAMVREIIAAQPHTRFDRAHFKEYGDSALVFEVVYYVLDRDYNVYMDTQQAINLALYVRFRDEGIEFAYPTRTLHIHHPAPAPDRA